MRSVIPVLLLSISFSLSVRAQTFKNLKVFVTKDFQPRESITVEALSHDPLIATDALKNALVMNGFKIISERVAKDRLEINNKGHVTDSTFNQNISVGSSTYVKSIYVVTFSYQARADTGCGGAVMASLSGQIIDLANDGQIVATFNFKQSNFEGKCTSDIMEALAKKLRDASDR